MYRCNQLCLMKGVTKNQSPFPGRNSSCTCVASDFRLCLVGEKTVALNGEKERHVHVVCVSTSTYMFKIPYLSKQSV